MSDTQHDLDHPDIGRRRRQVDVLLDLGRVSWASERWSTVAFGDYGITGITPTQARALMALVQTRRLITARELSEILGVSQVTVSRFVRSLESGGWIDRRPDPRDGRARLLVATEKTREVLPRFIAVTMAFVDRAFFDLPDADFEALERIVHRIRTNLEPDEREEQAPRVESSGS